jgi:hypothetical protein
MHPSTTINLIEFMSTQQLIITIEDIDDELIAYLDEAMRQPDKTSAKPDWLRQLEQIAGKRAISFNIREYAARIKIYFTELKHRKAIGDEEAAAYLRVAGEE